MNLEAKLQNARTRLRADFLNNLGAGAFTSGVLGPIATFALSPGSISDERAYVVAFISLLCFLLAVFLHLMGARHLTEIKDEF